MGAPDYRLHLFGGFALDCASDEGVPELPQRRAQATLAVLAVAGDLGCTRERLLGLLWPESDAGSARHNLRDVLYAVRRALGRESVSGAGDALRLDGDRVSSDVGAFSAALAAGDLREAVEAYRGPFLQGFFLDGAPSFERWVDDERARLLGERQQVVKRLAKRAEAEAHWDAAAGWWGRAAAVDPHNSRLAVRRMMALARAGDRAGALRVGEGHAARLRSELELEPGEAFLEELERIRSDAVAAAQFYTPAPRPLPDAPPDGSDPSA